MFNVSKLSRTARVPRSPRTTHVAPLMAHRTTGVLAALGIAAAGLAMTPRATRAPGLARHVLHADGERHDGHDGKRIGRQ